ncbi:hypothetical protein AALP_AAs71109U000200 [Arabis alpina]|uniref:CCHC-type domain-containing protein n=1 Tax=Arabis alpina TaxID=50452 RepID=A0A087FWS6_ARAAL|nr:hypothetical protein AALP_AAs71109U000200 [Arabis alpina]
MAGDISLRPPPQPPPDSALKDAALNFAQFPHLVTTSGHPPVKFQYVTSSSTISPWASMPRVCTVTVTHTTAVPTQFQPIPTSQAGVKGSRSQLSNFGKADITMDEAQSSPLNSTGLVGPSLIDTPTTFSQEDQMAPDSPSLASHVPFPDAPKTTQEGLGRVGDTLGLPVEIDEFKKRMVNLEVAHIKVKVNCTKPLPSSAELVRDNGEVITVSIEYPWTPPLCPYCKELGHLESHCPSAQWKPAAPRKVPQPSADNAPQTAPSAEDCSTSATDFAQPGVPHVVLGSDYVIAPLGTVEAMVVDSVIAPLDTTNAIVVASLSPAPLMTCSGPSDLCGDLVTCSSPSDKSDDHSKVVSNPHESSLEVAAMIEPASPEIPSPEGLLLPQSGVDYYTTPNNKITHMVGLPAHFSSRLKPVKLFKKSRLSSLSTSDSLVDSKHDPPDKNSFACLVLTSESPANEHPPTEKELNTLPKGTSITTPDVGSLPI